MIVKAVANGYALNSNYVCPTLAEVFEFDAPAFWFVDFKQHKESIKSFLLNYVEKIEDYDCALHVFTEGGNVTIGDFAIKFGQQFESWEQAQQLNHGAKTALDTFAADGVNEFINHCGHNNLIVGQRFLNKLYPRKLSPTMRRVWNDAKKYTKPFIRVVPGEYSHVYEYDIKGCYRSILANLPLPSGAPVAPDFTGSQFNLYVLNMQGKPEKWGLLACNSWDTVTVCEYTYNALKAQGMPHTVINKVCYKTSRQPFADFMACRPTFAEWEQWLTKLEKMKLNSLVGSFGKREAWDDERKEYTRGYYPVYLAVVDFARCKVAELVNYLLAHGKQVIYANTDSVFLTEPLGATLNAFTAPILKWTLRHEFIELNLRGCNAYDGITTDGVVIEKHSGVAK